MRYKYIRREHVGELLRICERCLLCRPGQSLALVLAGQILEIKVTQGADPEDWQTDLVSIDGAEPVLRRKVLDRLWQLSLPVAVEVHRGIDLRDFENWQSEKPRIGELEEIE